MACVGCARIPPPPERITIREPVEIRVPVAVGCAIAPELLAPLEEVLPVFVACPVATCSSGLTAEGETVLQRYLSAQRQRISAWRAWAAACQEQER